MFNIIAKKKIFFIFSIAITVIGIISFIWHGMNWDIDFTGGTEITANLGQTFDSADIVSLVQTAVNLTPTVQKASDSTTGQETDVIISTSDLDSDQRTAIYTALQDKYDINISDGTLMTINMGKSGFDESALSDVVAGVISTTPTVGSSYTTAYVKTATLTDAGVSAVKSAIESKYGLSDSDIVSSDFSSDVSSNNISPTVGSDLKTGALWATVIAIVLMMIYISFRFEFLSAISIIIAMIHDIIILLSVYSIFRIPVNLTFVAALLTVIGYSNHDSIVIFDRIRENLKTHKKETIAEVVNTSVWQTMRRSILTVCTVLITLVLLLILGVPDIRQFALPMIIGVCFGAYSSIFIAAQLWVMFVKGESRKA